MAKSLQVLTLLAVFYLIPGMIKGQQVFTEAGHKKVDSVCSANLPTTVKLDSINNTAYQDFSYLVTNDNDQIVKVISQGDRFALADNAIQKYRVRGIAYRGNLTAQPGMVISQASATSGDSLSPNFLKIQKYQFDGGRINSPKAINGTIEACYSSDSKIRFQSLQYKPSDAQYQYIITDFEQDTVKAIPRGNQFDIQKLGVGYFRLVGIAYKGQLKGLKVGELVKDLRATKCWAFSQNTITVKQSQVDGGQIQINDFNGDTLRLCKSKDFGSFGLEKETQARGDVSYRYVVTGQANDTIVRTPINDRLNFDQNGIGQWYVNGLSYQGILQNFFNGSRLKEVRSTGCMNYSNNHLMVRKDSLDVNAVSVNGNKDSLVIPQTTDKVLNGNTKSHATKGAKLAYLATSGNKDTLLALSRDGKIDPQKVESKVFYVNAVSYIGNLNSPQQGQLVDSLSFSYAQWSTNRVKVIKKDESSSYFDYKGEASPFRTFPNPANDLIHVRIRKAMSKNSQLQLVDANGKTLRTVVLDQRDSKHIQLDVAGLPSGQYVLSLKRPNKQPLSKTVILR